MSDNDGRVRDGGISLKKDLELIEYMLENAEIEYMEINNLEGQSIELSNGIVFYFDDEGELVNISNEL